MNTTPELIAKYLRREPLDPIQVLEIENDLWIDREYSFYPEVNDRIHFILVLDAVMEKLDEIEEELKS